MYTSKEALKDIANKSGLGKSNYSKIFELIEQDLTELEILKSYLPKWYEQLTIDGVNSKSMIRNDIQHLLQKYNINYENTEKN